MCNQNTIPSVNLQTAVLMQVQEFINSGQTFSRYDITKALRQKCDDGLLEIPEVENVNGGSYRYEISKQSVDDIFEQVYQNCLVNGLPPLTYRFNRAAGYREFSVDTSATAPVPTPSPSVYVSQPSVTPSVVTDDAEIRRRVDLYMTRCTQTGNIPTLKQIQSAIKRGNKSTGLSYKEIHNITTSLGYTV